MTLALDVLDRVATRCHGATAGIVGVFVLVVDSEALAQRPELAVDVEETVALAKTVIAVFCGLVSLPVIELTAINSIVGAHCSNLC